MSKTVYMYSRQLGKGIEGKGTKANQAQVLQDFNVWIFTFVNDSIVQFEEFLRVFNKPIFQLWLFA